MVRIGYNFHRLISVLSRSILSLGVIISLNACSGVVSLPGGTKGVNQDYYKSKAELLERVRTVKKGMNKEEVYDILEREEDDFFLLSRSEIVTAMYGTDNINFSNTQNFIHTLDGYRLDYSRVNRKHGFNTPISMKTKEDGFQYTVTLIFRDDVLYEEPIIAGGDVEGSNSKTIFEYLSPGRLVNSAF